MRYYRLLLTSFLLTAVFAGCEKDASDQECQLSQYMAANDIDGVRTYITRLIHRLPSAKYTEHNLNQLAAAISSQCQVQAEVLCFDCIQTLPTQTEIFLTITGSPGKVLDITYTPNLEMRFLTMHD